MTHGLTGTVRNPLKQGGNECDIERHETDGAKFKKYLILLAIPAGLEPATRGVEIRYSIQLSYGTVWTAPKLEPADLLPWEI